MDVLKKIRSATLVEALIATILIVIIFVIASLILNHLLLNTFSKNTHALDSRINQIRYQLQNDQIKVPYAETFEGFQISVKADGNNALLIETKQERTGQIEIKKVYHAD